MTKKEKALLQAAIDELKASLEIDGMSAEDIKNVEHHIDALLWVKAAIAKEEIEV